MLCRNDYIELLDQGKITKQQFNDKNLDLFDRLNLRPFSVLDSFEKALFNYNYYNAKAKQALGKSNRLREIGRLKQARKEEHIKLNCYEQKDIATLAMISLQNQEQIEAYPIRLHSRQLKDSIYEINFKDKEKVILHSKSEKIKDLLCEMGVFHPVACDSLIHNYVNHG